MAKRDWKNEKDFYFTDNLDSYGWAWEFLRRNLDYQNDWKKVLNHFLKKNPLLTQKEINDDYFCIEPDIIDCKAKWGILRFVNPIQIILCV